MTSADDGMRLSLTRCGCRLLVCDRDAPSSLVAHAVSFMKSKITGAPGVPGTHKTITLEGAEGTTKKAETKVS
jgi:hypothetical protein